MALGTHWSSLRSIPPGAAHQRRDPPSSPATSKSASLGITRPKPEGQGGLGPKPGGPVATKGAASAFDSTVLRPGPPRALPPAAPRAATGQDQPRRGPDPPRCAPRRPAVRNAGLQRDMPPTVSGRQQLVDEVAEVGGLGGRGHREGHILHGVPAGHTAPLPPLPMEVSPLLPSPPARPGPAHPGRAPTSPAVLGAEPRRELRHAAAGHVPRLAAPARGAPPPRPPAGRTAGRTAAPRPRRSPSPGRAGPRTTRRRRRSPSATRPAARCRRDYNAQHAARGPARRMPLPRGPAPQPIPAPPARPLSLHSRREGGRGGARAPWGGLHGGACGSRGEVE